ncbi:Cytochrome P450 protein [Gossypium arboreum]|uniref:diacylglycerol O-acyltransferase n=1 Tax=Gossypium arboreum TaxID=29729 RepID=A0A0B0NLJ6_GOSAR|nr:Cytochrome P450 protein [Gossypium arboreum]
MAPFYFQIPPPFETLNFSPKIGILKTLFSHTPFSSVYLGTHTIPSPFPVSFPFPLALKKFNSYIHYSVLNFGFDLLARKNQEYFSGFDDDDGDGEAAVNQYVADLSVGSPLSMDKPFWELHLLKAHNCVVFRIHHALGDGFSLMSMLMAGSGKVDVPAAVPPIKTEGIKSGKRRDRSLFVCDRKTVISGGDGVELWPRKLATAKFLLEDMKEVKRAIPNTVQSDHHEVVADLLLVPMVVQSVSEMVEKWGRSRSGEIEIEVCEWFQRLTEDVIMRTVFGSWYEDDDGKAIFRLQAQQMVLATQALRIVSLPANRSFSGKGLRFLLSSDQQD